MSAGWLPSLPGFMMPSGSSADLIACITCKKGHIRLDTTHRTSQQVVRTQVTRQLQHAPPPSMRTEAYVHGMWECQGPTVAYF